MSQTFSALFLFAAKAVIVVLIVFILLIGILSIASRGKEKLRGRIMLKNLSKKLAETKQELLAEVLSKDAFKKFCKEQKLQEKNKKKSASSEKQKNVFVINFNGDIKASAVSALREEVTAILGIAQKQDEVVVKLESGGGMVHAYGLAASQLMRFRSAGIPLTVVIDKVAASGGYMMACVADKVVAAPFAIVGSIGVILQLPNFNRLLKEKHIDFEQLTAGNFKRTLTMFGHNTEEGREKAREEIEEIHHLFKDLIHEHRKQVDIEKVATGEYWPGSQALELKLVDELSTSDDYLLKKNENAQLFEVAYLMKKSLQEKLAASGQAVVRSLIGEKFLI